MSQSDISPSVDSQTPNPKPATPKLTLEQILANDQMKSDLVSIGIRRFNASALYLQPYHDKWLRFFKLYRNIVDVVEDEDEPNTGVVYAYAIVEDLVSKISEPILQMRPPCRVAPRRAGQEPQADRFSAMAASYFRTGRYQLDYTNSTREVVICGNGWEQDCWYNEYETSRLWSKVKRTKMVDVVRGFFRTMTGQAPVEFDSVEEQTVQTPIKVGYGTRFPPIFRIFPEPHVHNVRDMHWLCEEMPAEALIDLKKRQYTGPDGVKRPFFNFSELEASYIGRTGEIKPEPMSRQRSTAEDELRTVTGDQPEKDRSLNYADDIDRVSLTWVWEPHRVFVIAQGRFIVAYQEDVFQSPRIPFRLKVYTPQKDFLFGLGALEPIENQINELSDIHKMSMRNWVRIINRMVAYDDSMVPFEDDFTPSALGRVRVRPGPGKSVADAIVPIHHDDVTPSMLAQESNVKGIIERAISVADYSPGTEGTKQTHKTLGGLMEISRNIAQRITTVQRMFLSAFQDQMWFMEKLHSQFLMDKTPFTVYGPDGSTAIEEFDLWDISTGGMGFDFIIEYDPSFGDDQLRRNQMMALEQLCFQYIQQSKALGLDVAMPDVEDIHRRVLKTFGWSDTSEIMKRPDGSKSPDDELKDMISGQPVMPQPLENLIQHLTEHMAQEQMLLPLVQQGKVPPRALLLLRAHIQATQQLIGQIMQNPAPLVQSKFAEKMQKMAPNGMMPSMTPANPSPSGAPVPQAAGSPPSMGVTAGGNQ